MDGRLTGATAVLRHWWYRTERSRERMGGLGLPAIGELAARSAGNPWTDQTLAALQQVLASPPSSSLLLAQHLVDAFPLPALVPVRARESRADDYDLIALRPRLGAHYDHRGGAIYLNGPLLTLLDEVAGGSRTAQHLVAVTMVLHEVFHITSAERPFRPARPPARERGDDFDLAEDIEDAVAE